MRPLFLSVLVLLAACDNAAPPAAPAAPAAPTPAAEIPDAAAALPAGHPPIDGVPTEAAAPAPVEKAQGEGAVTVAEAWAGKAELAGKPVRVHGRVVKFNAAIMGKNWVHLQDGSGSAADGSNDLLFTTSETVAVGDVVTLQGTLVTDQEFGAGYAYAVLVQDSTLVQ